MSAAAALLGTAGAVAIGGLAAKAGVVPKLLTSAPALGVVAGIGAVLGGVAALKITGDRLQPRLEGRQQAIDGVRPDVLAKDLMTQFDGNRDERIEWGTATTDERYLSNELRTITGLTRSGPLGMPASPEDGARADDIDQEFWHRWMGVPSDLGASAIRVDAQDVFARADANDDKVVSVSELQRFVEGADHNGSGAVDRAELHDQLRDTPINFRTLTRS